MKQDSNEIPKSLSGTLKFSNPVSQSSGREIGRLLQSKDHEYPFYYDGEKMVAITDFELRLDKIRSNGDYFVIPVYAAGPILKENQELKALCREVLTAREQYQFFVNGYANGSASISEANHAAIVEHEAYSKLWDYLKSKAQ